VTLLRTVATGLAGDGAQSLVAEYLDRAVVSSLGRGGRPTRLRCEAKNAGKILDSDGKWSNMGTPTIFDLCKPRPDVLAGTSSDSDFAADLSHVIRGTGGPAEYSDPSRFFANTYPTRGLKSLLANVCTRLSGRPGAVAAIFRLDTSFGGGKTHGLIALVHAARGMIGVANPGEFLDPALIPTGEVRIAAFDGENAEGRELKALRAAFAAPATSALTQPAIVTAANFDQAKPSRAPWTKRRSRRSPEPRRCRSRRASTRRSP
jgi:hypothetical protein